MPPPSHDRLHQTPTGVWINAVQIDQLLLNGLVLSIVQGPRVEYISYPNVAAANAGLAEWRDYVEEAR